MTNQLWDMFNPWKQYIKTLKQHAQYSFLNVTTIYIQYWWSCIV